MQEKDKSRKATNLEELFFYALYGWNAYLDFGFIPKSIANNTYKLTGYKVFGYKLRLNTSGLKHILSRHMFEKSSDQRALTIDDITNISTVLKHCTVIRRGNKPNSIVYEKHFPNTKETHVFVVEIDALRCLVLGKSYWIKTFHLMCKPESERPKRR